MKEEKCERCKGKGYLKTENSDKELCGICGGQGFGDVRGKQPSPSHSELNDGVMCAVGLLYQKIDGTQYINKIRVCFVDYTSGDDRYIIKARGEKYFAEHPDFKDELKEFNVVAWQCTVGENT